MFLTTRFKTVLFIIEINLKLLTKKVFGFIGSLVYFADGVVHCVKGSLNVKSSNKIDLS
jgi:hypothetical protein